MHSEKQPAPHGERESVAHKPRAASGIGGPTVAADFPLDFGNQREYHGRNGETARGAVLKVWTAILSIFALLLMGVSVRGAANGGQMSGSERTEVSGELDSADGSPLIMVRVELQATMGGASLTAYTDSAGRFSFVGVPSGNYMVVVRAYGYQPANWPINVDIFPVHDLILTLVPIKFRQTGGDVLGNNASTVSVRQLQIPDKARSEFRKGVESESHGRTDEAVKHWEKSIQIYPQFAESYMKLSKIYADRGDFEAATDAAKHAVEVDSDDAAPYAYLGFVYLKMKDIPEATKAFQDSVRISDTKFFTQFWLGDLLLKQKDYEEAYPHLLRAWQLNPEDPKVYLLLYNDLVLLDRREEALAKIDDFLSRFPNNPFAAKAREKREALAKSLSEENH
ncbi:MAG: carboxypeptidase regulatory-like domain-containing protein [Acidobacteriota bacterium]|nr:carboxypeptidase regulatory-like domain-containing protein [Acidobacteriota bacterium]